MRIISFLIPDKHIKDENNFIAKGTNNWSVHLEDLVIPLLYMTSSNKIDPKLG